MRLDVQMTPFPWSPRMPREYEIFRFDGFRHAKEFRKTYLGTFVGSAAKMTESKQPESQSTISGRPRDIAYPVPPVPDGLPGNTLANFQTHRRRHQNSISKEVNSNEFEREGEHGSKESGPAVERADGIGISQLQGETDEEFP